VTGWRRVKLEGEFSFHWPEAEFESMRRSDPASGKV
jgi:hypothetical protein